MDQNRPAQLEQQNRNRTEQTKTMSEHKKKNIRNNNHSKLNIKKLYKIFDLLLCCLLLEFFVYITASVQQAA